MYSNIHSISVGMDVILAIVLLFEFFLHFTKIDYVEMWFTTTMKKVGVIKSCLIRMKSEKSLRSAFLSLLIPFLK